MMTCAECGSVAVTVERAGDRFPYADTWTTLRGDTFPVTVWIVAFVDFITCGDCGSRFTGQQAEDARAAAVRDYLEGQRRR